MLLRGWAGGGLLCVAAAIAGTSCDGTAGGSPGASFTTPATMPLLNTSPTASLSGTWVGLRPGEGLALYFPGCGACAGTPSLNAGDVILSISDSNHALSGNATVTIVEAPVAGCPAEPDCNHGPVGEVIPASVTGAVTAGGRVTMRWEGTLGRGGEVPTAAVFILEGRVSANRMSGTVIVTGPAVPGDSADGTWSVILR